VGEGVTGAQMERIVLGYDGGFDATLALGWLAERFGAEVIAVTLDLGQGRELTEIKERALAGGAIRAHVLDVRDEFARGYLLPYLRAGAFESHGYQATKALGRALIARKLVEIARMEDARAIAHACEPASDAELQIETAARTLDRSVDVIAPRRERTTIEEEATVHTDATLWGRSIDADGAVKDPTTQLYTLTRAADECPDEAAFLEIEFEGGTPVQANGIDMPPLELIESIETIAGAHGVGRFNAVDERGRRIHEAPAALVLTLAHAELERATVPADLAALKTRLTAEYTRLIRQGRWFTPAREAIDAFVEVVERVVHGSIRLELLKGRCRAVASRTGAPPSASSLEPSPPAAVGAATDVR
jgi:argininosuccinate synthase